MNYLEKLVVPEVAGRANPDTVLPPRLSGSGEFETSLLERMRRQQLADIARAYDLIDQGFNPDWPKPRMLSFLKRYESEMLFHTPPRREFYYMRAAYTADQIQDSKFQKADLPRGWFQDGAGRVRECEALKPWAGSDPDAIKLEPKPAKAQSEPEREYKTLHKVAAALGLNSFAMKKDELESAVLDAAKKAGNGK